MVLLVMKPELETKKYFLKKWVHTNEKNSNVSKINYRVQINYPLKFLGDHYNFYSIERVEMLI